MSLKEDLIKFIMFNCTDYSEEYLEKLSIEALVICKVEIELKALENRNDSRNSVKNS